MIGQHTKHEIDLKDVFVKYARKCGLHLVTLKTSNLTRAIYTLHVHTYP